MSDDGYALFLRPQIWFTHFDRHDPKLTMEGAAGHFWSPFIEWVR